MQKHTRTCTYTGTCTLRYTHTHTRISSTTPQPLIPTVASPGFRPRLCGAVGKRGGDPGLLEGNSSRRGLGGLISPKGEWGAHREVCVCAQCVKGLRGPSPGQRCLAAWALQGAPETGNLYMEPPSAQTLHSQLHTVYCKKPPPLINSHTHTRVLRQ